MSAMNITTPADKIRTEYLKSRKISLKNTKTINLTNRDPTGTSKVLL